MNDDQDGGASAYAVLALLGLVAFGIVTRVPWLFNALGVALYVAILRECGRHIIPWPKARRIMRLDKINTPAPPAPPERGSTTKHLIREDRPGHWAVTPNPDWKDND